MEQLIERSARILADTRKLVISTGAGVSRESGIPTFRETQSGLWANFDPEELATVEGFLKDPPLVWKWYQERIKMISDVQPNPGHYAMAKMQHMFEDFCLITQNIDNLHQKAGAKEVCELHGNILTYKCFDEQTIIEVLPETDEIPPRCQRCGAMIRPNVVWFGEALPEKEMSLAYTKAGECHVMIVAGTSGLVQPAASLPLIAKRYAKAKIIEINPTESAITPVADIFLKGKSGEVLPKLLEAIEKIRE
jgi:NAD-dependent deacetylase